MEFTAESMHIPCNNEQEQHTKGVFHSIPIPLIVSTIHLAWSSLYARDIIIT